MAVFFWRNVMSTKAKSRSKRAIARRHATHVKRGGTSSLKNFSRRRTEGGSGG